MVDILQDEMAWTLVPQDSSHIEKERPTGILKTRTSPCDREGLAGETSEKDIECGDVLSTYGSNIPNVIVTWKMTLKNLTSRGLYLRSKDALAGMAQRCAGSLKTKPKPADTSEQIDELVMHNVKRLRP